MRNHPKIVPDLAGIIKLLSDYRQQQKKIVLTQGSFDMIHIGHGRYLQKAKEQGDILLVGVDDDAKIRHRKGPDRPVVPQDERLEMLCYLSSVDHVILKALQSPRWQLIKTIRPDVLVATHGTYSDKELAELKEWCGTVLVFAAQATTSTSAKLRRLQIGFAHDFTTKLTPRIEDSIEAVIKELEG